MKEDNAPLVLYYFQSCPFCIKVLEYMKSSNIVIPMHDILVDPEAMDQLIRIGGKQQVPCLVVGGKALYESEDIMMWFEKHGDPYKN
jgi:glutaredoxin 3